jgi:hypothetical protein
MRKKSKSLEACSVFHRKTNFVQNIFINSEGKGCELTEFLPYMLLETPFIHPAATNWPIVIAPDERYLCRFVG